MSYTIVDGLRTIMNSENPSFGECFTINKSSSLSFFIFHKYKSLCYISSNKTIKIDFNT